MLLYIFENLALKYQSLDPIEIDNLSNIFPVEYFQQEPFN